MYVYIYTYIWIYLYVSCIYTGHWLIGGQDEESAGFKHDKGTIKSRVPHFGMLPDASGLRWWFLDGIYTYTYVYIYIYIYIYMRIHMIYM